MVLVNPTYYGDAWESSGKMTDIHQTSQINSFHNPINFPLVQAPSNTKNNYLRQNMMEIEGLQAKSTFHNALSHFENNIKANSMRDEVASSSCITRVATSQKRANGNPPRSPRKLTAKKCVPKATVKSHSSKLSPKTSSKKTSSESYTSATMSESDASTIASPKQKSKPTTWPHRASIGGNLIDIPESTAFENTEEILDMSIVLSFDEDETFASPRRGSMCCSQDWADDERSVKSSISRMSPKIRSLPRDLDFDSSSSSVSLDEEDSEVLQQSMRDSRKPAAPRFW